MNERSNGVFTRWDVRSTLQHSTLGENLEVRLHRHVGAGCTYDISAHGNGSNHLEPVAMSGGIQYEPYHQTRRSRSQTLVSALLRGQSKWLHVIGQKCFVPPLTTTHDAAESTSFRPDILHQQDQQSSSRDTFRSYHASAKPKPASNAVLTR